MLGGCLVRSNRFLGTVQFVKEISCLNVQGEYLCDCRRALEMFENVLVNRECSVDLAPLFEHSGLVFEIGNRRHRSPVFLWTVFPSL